MDDKKIKDKLLNNNLNKVIKNKYELFIEKLESKINKECTDFLKMNGRILNDTTKLNINFDILIYEDSIVNPFDDEVELYIEFIEDEQPYIQIISNFLNPTMYDIKNYFLCLSSKSCYIFKITDLVGCQQILEEIVSNIKFFLHNIKDSENFKTFIYFGEYSYKHIYHINDFLRNNERIDFFRVNQIKNDKFCDKVLYIICTELFLIVFEPVENNKSLGKILFYKKLSEIDFQYEEIGLCYDKKNIKKLKIFIYDIKNKILYKELNDDIKTDNKFSIIKYNHINDKSKNYNGDILENNKNDNKINIDIINKSENNNIFFQNNSINNINDIKNKFEFLFLSKTSENEDNDNLILQNEYILFKKFMIKKDVLKNLGYNIIITPYRLMYGHPINENDRKHTYRKMREEIDKILEYDEKIYEKYKNSKKEFDKKRVNNSIENIIYVCTKISSSLIDDNKINYYLDKMRKYAVIMQ